MTQLRSKLNNIFAKNPYGYLLKMAWTYAAGMRGRYLLIYALFTGVNLVVSLQPIFWGYFVNFLQVGEGDLITGSLYYVLAYLGIILVTWAFQWPARLMERKMAFEIGERLLLESYDKIVHLPLGWHREHHSGDTINRARKAYEALKGFFDNGFAYFQTMARMAIAIGAIIYFSPLFGAIAGVFGVIILLTVLYFDGPIIKANQETNDRENDLLASLTDNLGNIITVKTLRLGAQTAAVIKKRIANIWPPFLRNTKINEFKWFAVAVESGVMYCLLVFGYVYLNYTPGEAFLIGGLVTLVGYVNQFTGMLFNLTGQYNQIIKFRSDLSAIEPIYADAARESRPQLSGHLNRDWQSLTVQNLTFRYGQDGGGIHGLHLNLPRGKRIALIGPSGSGKTTALYTLRGLYPPERIEISFDSRAPVKNAAELYEQTTLIPQTPEIFEDTFRNNLTMGLPRAEAAIAHAIEVSVLAEVIEAAESGLDTFLAEGGANLSGGQRQRLSIARGLLAAQSSTLLLLDEPTSSLDPKTEVDVYERLFAAYPEKTIVSTLHRLHLLRFFDHIYYLENGKVTAEGSLAELLATSGAFRSLYDKQIVG
ncbi:ABC transporter ATP-binding protein [Lewinella sp. 4G2]|uniref:ABC transporter ATP-binding protein n=1 Tax=Lewinella sp. 4G2 TaxID=1803372 RepID=UPI0007B46DFA|nr:ABC transporter ATP-binding protein [Lewinella sp. 4G2]OAV43248.1 hypothetical protein A3850_001490 [Lewinella sp. 4G2]